MRSKKAIFNILTNLFLQLIVILYGFIVPKIIISNFGSNVNGLIASITQFLAYIALLESGFGPVVKAALYKPIANKNKNEIEGILKSSEKFFRTIAKIFIIYILVLCILYPLIVKSNFDYIYTASLIIIISISTFAEYYFGMTYKLYLQANQKNYVISIIQIFTYILSITFIVILVKFDISIHLVKLISGLIFVLRPLMQNMYIKKKYNISLKNSSSNYKIAQKWDGLAQHIAFVIHKNTDITILTLFSNLSSVSVYAVYNMIVTGINSIIRIFSESITSGFGDMIAKGENENLNRKFNMYEVMYFSISTVLFTCAILLIVPFVTLYTKGIVDADYVQHGFGHLLVISEFIWAIRLPYNSLVLAAGHFKQTKIGAWVECIVNILLSIILVRRYGLIGVAIGTTVAMTIRSIEIINYVNKNILKRTLLCSVKKILLIIIETLIIVFVCRFIPYLSNTNYINWIVNGIITFSIACLIVLTINVLIFKSEYIELYKTLKRIFNMRRNKCENKK